MQTHYKLKARILSLALSAAMVTTMMPMNAFAAEGGTAPGTSSVGTIQSFDKLEDRFTPSVGENAPDYVYGLSVALNTPYEDLNLPDELTAMVKRTTVTPPAEDEPVVDSGKEDTPAEDEPVVDSGKEDAPAEDEPVVDSGKEDAPAEDETIPDEDIVVDEDSDTDNTVSGNQPASPSEAKEEVKEEIEDDNIPLAQEPDQDEETTVTTSKSESIPVKWESNMEYRSDENGKFIYTAVIPEGYILADGLELPQIYVMVGRQARASNSTYTVGTGGKYLTLSDAMEDSYNVTQKTTLKLISDITESGINNDQSIGIYIDLNGHTLKSDGMAPLFTGNFQAYIINTGLAGGTLDINGQNPTVYDVPTRTGSSCFTSTSSADAPITIKNSGSGGTLSLPSFFINPGSYVILDQSVTLENPGYPGTKLGINLMLNNSTLINNGTIKTESRGGIVGTVKNEATGKIYIGAGNVESIDNTTSGSKVYVTGGSVKTITDTGNEGNVFFGEAETTPAVQYIFTLNDGTADLGDNIFVNALTTTPAYTYGMDGVKTRDTGKLYIWVPSGLTEASATVPSSAGESAGTYFNAAVSGTTATLTKATGPTIGINTQPTSPAAMTYGAITGSLTVAGTASNNNTVSYQWYKNTSNSTTGGTAVTGATSASFTIPTSLDAGTYYYYCNLKATDCADKASNVATVTVNKANATDTMKTVATNVSKDGKAGATVSLPTKPAGATYGTPTVSGTITMTDMSISGDTLTYTAPASTAGQTGVITIPVTTATNYNDYSITVTITSVDKTPVTISGLSAATGLIYNGNAQKGYTGTISVEGNKVPVNELLYTYTSTDSGTHNSSTAPTNAGAYKLVVSVVDSNANYTGAHADILFTIGKATVTITADNKRAYVGDVKPALTYTATGKASSDTLTTEPTLEYESEPDMSKAGSVKIKAKDAVVPNTDNYESAITYVDGTLTISTKSSGGGGGGGGGSSSGGSTTTPPVSKPTEPVTGNSNINATVDNKGNATVNVTDKNISDAVQAAKDAASKKGVNAGEVTAVINVTAPANSNPNMVTVNLPKNVQEQVISNKIGNLVIVIDKPDISIGMNLATITEMNKQANADIQLSATRTDATKLSTEAKNAIGSRPAFDLKATYASGSKSITNFGSGTVSVAIPYTLQAGEVAGGLYAVYVDGNGKVTHLVSSSYDAENKVLRFSTNHFSVYGIGYKAPVGLTDIANHWAKTDIEFVVGRGLMTGTSNTAFSPDGSMTLAMFVTALGRLANVDTNSYKTGNLTDVKADAYYAPYVNWAASKGITSGTTTTTYSPDNTVTRQEMAVFMSNYAKAMGYTVPETRAAVTFADNGSIGSGAAAAVKQMQMAGVLNGKKGNKFDPTGTATRAEVAAVLHRYVELVIDRTTTEGWTTDDSGSSLYYKSGKSLVGTQTIGGVAYTFNSYGETIRKIATEGATTQNHIIYTVKKDDWLSQIALANNCTVEEILVLNGIKDKNLIYQGQQIKVPQK